MTPVSQFQNPTPEIDPDLLNAWKSSKPAQVDFPSLVRSAATKHNIPEDVTEDYLKVTSGIESGNKHYRNGQVLRSDMGALGGGQLTPDQRGRSTKVIQGTTYDLRDPAQNAEAGLRYFHGFGGDPIARRIGYFSGDSGSLRHYNRTGKIPNGGERDPKTGKLRTSFQQYIERTGGFQSQPSIDPDLLKAWQGASQEQPTQPAPAQTDSSEIDPELLSAWTGKPTQPKEKVTVSLGEGAEMASPEEIAAYKSQATPQSIKPIEFQQGAPKPASLNPIENLSDIASGGQVLPRGVAGLQARKYEVTPSQQLGDRVELPLPKDSIPLEDDVVNAYLGTLGAQYVELGKRYKEQTGHNILTLGGASLTLDDQGQYHVRPTKGAIDFLNAYARGEGDAAAEANRQADEHVAAMNKAYEVAKPDVAEAKTAMGNVGDNPLVRKMFERTSGAAQAFGTILPGSVGNEFERQAAVEKAAGEQLDKEKPFTTTRERILGGIGGLVPTAAMLIATHKLGPAQLAALGVLEGSTPEERLRGGMQGATAQTVLGGAPAAFTEAGLPITGKAVTSAAMVAQPAVEAWQRGESPTQAITENLPFAALPFLHAKFGKVESVENQSGVPKGEIRVREVDNPDVTHVIIKPSIRKNQRAIPVPSESAQPAERPESPLQTSQEVPPVSAERPSTPEAAQPAQAKTTASPAREMETVKPLSTGNESTATTERGTSAKTRYAIVEADSLITSHDDSLNRNPDFPEELQPRERERAASQTQIDRIAKNPRPELLSESPKASDGAPIIGQDGLVESGNARTLGLRRAYRNGKADEYRQYLLDNAEGLGLDRNAIENAKEPVLVRLRTSEVDRPQFVREANESSVAAMSAPEQAKSDAKTLTSDLLSTFRPSESGELNTTANTPFIRNFMRDIVSPNDLGRYVSAEGELSQEGLARIRNAIFARAYGDSPEGLRALEKIAESPDNNVRNITNALLQRAGQFASLKDAIAKGDRYPLDLTSDLTKALGKLSSLREEETSVADYLNQRQLFEEDLTPLQKQALKMFDEYKRSTKAISSVLDNYAKAVEAIGDPKQQSMFGGETPSKDSIFDAAIRETIDDAKRQSDLFSGERVQPEPATRPSDQAIIETAQAQTSGKGTPTQEPEFVRAARERAAQRLAEKQQGIEYRHAGADPYELLDSLIVRGWELYDQKVRPTFEEWARKLREEFGPKAEEHLRTVWAQVSGGEQTGKRQSEIPGMEQTPPETTGIAHRVETAARGAEPLRGQAIGAQESIERGRQLLREGGNLKAALDGFEKSGAISADAVALVRARHEELAQAANRAFDVGRQKLDSPEFRAAEKVRQDFYDNAVKPMQTAWSNTGRAQQGETDIDTETFYGMYRAFKDFKGREPSPREAVEIQLLAERNARVDSDVKNLSSQLAAELDRAAGIKDLPGEVQKSLSRFIDQAKRESRRTGRQQTRKSLDDEAVVIKQSLAAAFQKVREQKGVQPSGLARLDPEGEVTKQVIALAKNRVKAGVTDAAQLIDDVHGAIKEFADVTKREVNEAILGQGTPKGTRVESEWAKTKKGVAASLKAEDIETTQRELGERLQRGPISPEDASAVWKYARENYADKGNNNFAEIRAKVASDLGISPETVTRSLANTKAAKQISNEMWAKMSDRRRLRSNAESWIKQADAPLAVKLFDDARRLWFIKATVGHGAVAPFTHAPANAFIPARWADFWRNFGRTYQFMVNKGGHERAMSDLETSPNYITAQRAGLANDPKRGYDEYQSPWMGKVLGKLGVSGNRAFDSLKTMRQDMFDSAWNKMTNDLKTPETAKALVQEINASTGSSKALSGQDWPSRFVGKAMFAAPLEASRWDFLVRDNYRAIKAFTNWKNATLGERYMAKRVASRNAQLVATYGALLAANQGLLNASGSDDKINVTDPTKSDFLAFKVGGHVVSPAGGLLTAVRFVGNLVNIGTENKKPREKISDASTVTFKYGRSKLSPLFGTGADIWLQSDYSGRPLPFSKEEGTSKFPRYTWPEYIWSTQTPIPLAEAARTYYAEREKGTSRTDALAKSVPIGAVAATGIRVREDFPSGPASDIYGSDRPKARKEIERLGMQVRGVSKQPDESLKEFEARQAGVNPYIRRALEQVVSDPEYQKDSDLNKIERLKQAKEAAQKEGQAAWDDEHEKPEKDEKPEYPRPSGAPQASLKHWLPPRNPFKRGSESFRV